MSNDSCRVFEIYELKQNWSGKSRWYQLVAFEPQYYSTIWLIFSADWGSSLGGFSTLPKRFLKFGIYFYLQNPASVHSKELVGIALHALAYPLYPSQEDTFFGWKALWIYISRCIAGTHVQIILYSKYFSWINGFLTLRVFLVVYNLWKISLNGGSPHSREVDFGSFILKQSTSLLYKILFFSGFCIQSSSHTTLSPSLSLTLLLFEILQLWQKS